MIPKKLHFTYKTKALPDKYSENIAVWKQTCPDWEFNFYTDADIASFFSTYFPQYSHDISQIKSGVILSDIFRYGVLYIFGGLYSDIDTTPACSLPKDWLNDSLVLGYEHETEKLNKGTWYDSNVICQWSMLAKPRHPLFKEALEKGLENLRKTKFSFEDIKDVLHATGPLFFTPLAKKYLSLPETRLLEMEVFGSIPEQFPPTDKSIILHQFDGQYGWTVSLKCPFIDLR